MDCNDPENPTLSEDIKKQYSTTYLAEVPRIASHSYRKQMSCYHNLKE